MSELGFSSIGFGAWAIGGDYKYGWGPCNPVDAIEAIRAASELGINWIDTAPVYGYGHSERVVGLATRAIPRSMTIASKCGLRWDKTDTLLRTLKPALIEREVDDSLLRLGVDCIELLQTHWPDLETPIEETWGALSMLVKKGKVRFLGACNCDVDSIRRMEKIYPVASVQVPYSLLRRDIEDDILPYCRDRNISVLAYSPMHSGVLSGKYDRTRLNRNDWRLRKPGWYNKKAENYLPKVVDILARWAVDRDATPGQIAIAWVTSHPDISSAIVGARSSEQVRENAAAASLHLTSHERELLAAEIEGVGKPLLEL